MADVSSSQVPEQVDTGVSELQRLKQDLHAYRELILPLNKVLEWEKTHYPAILLGGITLLFAIIWYLEPSVLTTLSLIGISLCVVDFVVPTLSSYLFSSAEWTVVQERQFEGICVRVLNAKTHMSNIKNALLILKRDKPKAYLLLMMGAFAVLAWIGSLLDNLLLVYLLVAFLVMVPGLRKHGILQKVTGQLSEAISKLLKKKEKSAPKSKTN
ncbi:hypothetical protein CAPTEDRAFT_193769 [Capitella teleta]|uniref:RETREG1-3/ARL6IP-like N-terminal reticulon-homology domain-containing protein n=1 Tax=Capitella teleta TaxID=283909 RepID=R7VG67_CAPTE|nr:hypothetical protein CAPTEDRAFT_193769 [Capitella teleta]|eukprot:ELU15291.1 hypothetical protein CAPTEDRAFT_193769 [Capitella teleta]